MGTAGADLPSTEAVHEALSRGDAAAADGLLTRILAERPGEAEAWFIRAALQPPTEAPGEWTLPHRRFLALAPADARGWFNFGNGWRVTGQEDLAVSALVRAGHLVPSFVDCWINLGTLLEERGLPEPAFAAFRRALALAPGHATIHRNLGTLFLQMGGFASAATSFQQAAMQQPGDANAYLGFAAALTGLGARQPARAASEAAAVRMPVALHPAAVAEPVRVLVLLGLGTHSFGLDRERRPLIKRDNNIDRMLDQRVVERLELWTDRYAVDPAILERLPPVHVVLNGLSDPDSRAPALPVAEEIVRRVGGPVLNPPARIGATARDRIADTLAGIAHLHCPLTRRLPVGDRDPGQVMAAAAAAGLTPPFLLRQPGTHWGASMILVEKTADMADFLAGADGPDLFAIRFFQGLEQEDGLFRRLRLYGIGGRLYAGNIHYDRQWNVHGDAREALMLGRPALMQEEQLFLEDWRGYVGQVAAAALQAISDRLQLDYFGIDFTLNEAGEVLLFEANPAMAIIERQAETFPYLAPVIEGLRQAATEMVLSRAGREHS